MRFWNLSDLAWPLHVKLMFRRAIVCAIFLLLTGICHAADTLYSPSFTAPYPHSCDTFFSSRSPPCCPIPAFSGRFPHACTVKRVSSDHHLVHCHDLYVFEYSCPNILTEDALLSTRLSLGHQTSPLLFYGKSRVNSCVPLQRQSACSMGKSALTLSACCSSITSASTDCRIGLYSTQKAPEI